MQKVHCYLIYSILMTSPVHYQIPTAYRVTISFLFQYLLLLNSISNFPLQYFSLSLNLLYLALEDGSPVFRQVFTRRTFTGIS